MKVRVFTKKVPRTFIEIDEQVFLVSGLQEALLDLEDADGAIIRVCISRALGDFLVKHGVAFRNARGSYGRGDNYEEFTQELEKQLEGTEYYN